MFDFLRNLTKSNEARQQEKLSAYLDNGLTPQERLSFEEALQADTALQADLAQQRLIKQSLSSLPRLGAPRNFMLDPALYGRPTPRFAFQLYPVLRTATALAAIVLIFLFSLDLFSSAGVRSDTLAQAPTLATGITANEAMSETAVEQPPPAAEPGMFDAAGAAAGETAEEELAAEPAADSAPVEELMEEPMAEEAAPPAEEAAASEAVDVVVEEEGVAADTEPTEAAAAGLVPAATVEPPKATGRDGTVTDTLTVTATQRISQSTTEGLGGVTAFYSDTETLAADDGVAGIVDNPPLSTRRMLQIGLGLLLLVLLTGTWLLRRQL